MSPDPHLFVTFGATGDLNRRKLLPALYEISQAESAPHFAILGASRSQLSDEDFATLVAESLVEFAKVSEADARAWLKGKLHFQSLTQEEDPYKMLVERVHALEEQHRLGGNAVYYLSLPPQVFPKAIEGLGKYGANDQDGWTRLVVEKPFGHDLESARELNALVHEYFEEEQVYRIDHYLGKETVQNLLAFRFANALFEPLWNRDRIQRIEITVAESLGVEDRATYYDQAGALKDMIQNHLTQLLTVIAMDVPASFTAPDIKVEKLKVLESIRPIEDDDIIFGQYAASEDGKLPAYLDEEDIPQDSQNDTYVAVSVRIDTWRWQGVPFLLRTGKRLPQKLTQIAIVFQCAPVSLFNPEENPQGVANDVLLINIAPEEGVEMLFNVKQPGQGMRLQRQHLNFKYSDTFGDLPDAYTALLYDVMEGDRTLFVSAAEVEASWAVYEPLLTREKTLHPYPAGSWGPEAARNFAADWETGGE